MDIFDVLGLIGGLCLFLFGMNVMGESLERRAGSSLRNLLGKLTTNKFTGFLTGLLVTAVIQSSSATTVMVVGFVNTGLINLAQATALIMGANIGTTITAQLAALSSFDFGAYAILTAGLGAFITMLGKKDRTKTIGNALTGFGILFLGLECMSLAIKNPDAEGNKVVFETIKNLLSTIDGQGAWIILFLLGIVLTALVQSSSLITTIIISQTIEFFHKL